MAATPWTTDRLQDEIALLAARGLPRQELFAELGPRLRRVVASDAMCWHTLDPHTRLMTSDAPDELVAAGVYTSETVGGAGELMARSEYLIDDVNRFADVAARRTPVGILDQVTRGRPERSARYRDLLLPSGIPHEMRAAFLIRGRVWGAVHIARREGAAPFTDADAAAMARVSAAIASGIRASLRFDAARRGDGVDAPGLILLGPDDAVELVTPPAHALLDEIRSDVTPAAAGLPTAVAGLAGFTRRAGADAAAGANVVTVPGADGWITLHASLPDATGRVAIVVERAVSRQSATLRLEVHGATAKEREVATLLARGLSTAEIAAALVVSPHTVHDHVKRLFEKVGVSTRQELVARVFLEEYLPEVMGGTDIASTGRFEESPA
jgi:DNA-binding CsgD family transcriptional regulator